MSGHDYSSLQKSLLGLMNAINKQVTATNRKVTDRTGNEVTSQIKEWYGVTMSVNGEYSFDFTSAGFIEILHVDPQVIHDSDDFNAQGFASVNELSLTSVRGKVIQGAAKIFKNDGLTLLPVATVMIKVIGY